MSRLDTLLVNGEVTYITTRYGKVLGINRQVDDELELYTLKLNFDVDRIIDTLLRKHKAEVGVYKDVSYQNVMRTLGILGGADCIDGLCSKFGMADEQVSKIMEAEVQRMCQRVLDDAAADAIKQRGREIDAEQGYDIAADEAAHDAVVEAAAAEITKDGKHAVFVGLEDGVTMAFLFNKDEEARMFSQLMYKAGEIRMFDHGAEITYGRHGGALH